MKNLPQMVYVVGQEKTCCSETAEKLAKESGATIQYVVADSIFEKERPAKQALAEADNNDKLATLRVLTGLSVEQASASLLRHKGFLRKAVGQINN